MEKYDIKIEDAQDGSGDGLLTFPENFIEDYGWRAGDRIHMAVEGESLVLKNLDWIDRENLHKQTSLPLDKPLQDS